ncbi:MAG: glycosyltransferase [Oscillospiraceae bacterium]|nr:glycosyltransferase [Oscillospiraceae bacterium]
MKKQLLIISYDLEIGGVERSLLGLLGKLDVSKYDIDLLLFSQSGEFMEFLPKERLKLLPEIPAYKTFRMSIAQVLRSGRPDIAAARLLARLLTGLKKGAKNGYAMQLGWNLSAPFLPKITKEYDAAISFLWPHHCCAFKVNAKCKIAWIHTDYSRLNLNRTGDSRVWNSFDYIAAVSDENRAIFGQVYPELAHKTVTIENILDSDFVKAQAEAFVPAEMPPSNSVRLLTIGRYCEAKAFDRAIHACKLLKDRGVKVKWYAIGYGELENELQSLVAQLDLAEHFIILGKKTNPYPYIKACDIYVQPSSYEGKAVTVREAQILGKPVLITNFASSASQLRDGFDGLICPMSAGAVADTLIRLIEDKSLYEKLVNNIKNTDYSNNDAVEIIDKLFGNKV